MRPLTNSSTAMKLGFIGLGVMGRPMALNLMKHGHQMGVYARRPQSVAPLIAAGAVGYKTPAELAAACDVIFTVVTASGDFEQVALGENGIIQGRGPAAWWSTWRRFRRSWCAMSRGHLRKRASTCSMRPVSGGPMGAEQATLSIMAGGKGPVFERIKPLFECLGKTILHMGDHGAGQITKACNQLLLVVTAQGSAEALSLAARCGVDPAKVREVMLGGIAASRVLELFGKRMVERDFAAGIEARLYHKDLHIALDLVHELGLAAPAAALAMQTVNAVIGRGEGRNDLSALIKVVEGMSKA